MILIIVLYTHLVSGGKVQYCSLQTGRVITATHFSESMAYQQILTKHITGQYLHVTSSLGCRSEDTLCRLRLSTAFSAYQVLIRTISTPLLEFTTGENYRIPSGREDQKFLVASSSTNVLTQLTDVWGGRSDALSLFQDEIVSLFEYSFSRISQTWVHRHEILISGTYIPSDRLSQLFRGILNTLLFYNGGNHSKFIQDNYSMETKVSHILLSANIHNHAILENQDILHPNTGLLFNASSSSPNGYEDICNIEKSTSLAMFLSGRTVYGINNGYRSSVRLLDELKMILEHVAMRIPISSAFITVGFTSEENLVQENNFSSFGTNCNDDDEDLFAFTPTVCLIHSYKQSVGRKIENMNIVISSDYPFPGKLEYDGVVSSLGNALHISKLPDMVNRAMTYIPIPSPDLMFLSYSFGSACEMSVGLFRSTPVRPKILLLAVNPIYPPGVFVEPALSSPMPLHRANSNKYHCSLSSVSRVLIYDLKLPYDLVSIRGSFVIFVRSDINNPTQFKSAESLLDEVGEIDDETTKISDTEKINKTMVHDPRQNNVATRVINHIGIWLTGWYCDWSSRYMYSSLMYETCIRPYDQIVSEIINQRGIPSEISPHSKNVSNSDHDKQWCNYLNFVDQEGRSVTVNAVVYTSIGSQHEMFQQSRASWIRCNNEWDDPNPGVSSIHTFDNNSYVSSGKNTLCQAHRLSNKRGWGNDSRVKQYLTEKFEDCVGLCANYSIFTAGDNTYKTHQNGNCQFLTFDPTGVVMGAPMCWFWVGSYPEFVKVEPDWVSMDWGGFIECSRATTLIDAVNLGDNKIVIDSERLDECTPPRYRLPHVWSSYHIKELPGIREILGSTKGIPYSPRIANSDEVSNYNTRFHVQSGHLINWNVNSRGRCIDSLGICECFPPYRGVTCSLIDDSVFGDIHETHCKLKRGDSYAAGLHYLTSNLTSDVNDLMHSLNLLWKNWNLLADYPVIIFHDGLSRKQMHKISYASSNRIWFAFVEGYNEVPQWIQKSPHFHPMLSDSRWSIGYRSMCRFRSGPLFDQPILQNFDYLMTLDTDGYFPIRLEFDPILRMHQEGAIYSFSHILSDQRAAVRHFWDHTLRYMTSRGISPLGTPLLRQFVDPNSIEWNFRLYMNDIEIMNLHWFWKVGGYSDYYRFLDSQGGWFLYRWGDHAVRTLAIAMFSDPLKVIQLEMPYAHQAFCRCRIHPLNSLQEKFEVCVKRKIMENHIGEEISVARNYELKELTTREDWFTCVVID